MPAPSKHYKSQLIQNEEASPPVLNDIRAFGGRLRVATSGFSLDNSGDASFDTAHVIHVCKLPSYATIAMVMVKHEDMGTGSGDACPLNLGLYTTDNSATYTDDIVDIDCFCAGGTVAGTWDGLKSGNHQKHKPFALANKSKIGQPLWEWALDGSGDPIYTKDPGIDFYVSITAGTVTNGNTVRRELGCVVWYVID